MSLIFQPAQLADRQTLLNLMRDFYEHEDSLVFDPIAAQTALEGLLQDNQLGQVWLIQFAGQSIGYVVLTWGYSLEHLGRDAFIDELYLQPDHRGRGFGRQTLDFLDEICRSLKIRALHLEVDRGNAKAQNLYQSAGFRDRDYYLMSKKFTPG